MTDAFSEGIDLRFFRLFGIRSYERSGERSSLEPLKYRPTYEPPCLSQVLATPPYKLIYRFIVSFEDPFLNQKNYLK